MNTNEIRDCDGLVKLDKFIAIFLYASLITNYLRISENNML